MPSKIEISARLKRVTGHLLAFCTRLHLAAIRTHVQQYGEAAAAAEARRAQAYSDLKFARAAYGEAQDAELEAHLEHSSAQQVAAAEIAALPDVDSYGTVRVPPPFGATPTIIDKRSA